jgi:hypothetical protein
LTEKPECQLFGEDGNVFSIIGNVRRTLKRAGQPEKADEFSKRAFDAKSYAEVLGIVEEYVEVS